ncbi:MAG: hypothetical protein M0T84_15545 [Betaproteobacteria bacterium]|nr:hypothetical protein [Betaproteobacteria bacterium]
MPEDRAMGAPKSPAAAAHPNLLPSGSLRSLADSSTADRPFLFVLAGSGKDTPDFMHSRWWPSPQGGVGRICYLIGLYRHLASLAQPEAARARLNALADRLVNNNSAAGRG